MWGPGPPRPSLEHQQIKERYGEHRLQVQREHEAKAQEEAKAKANNPEIRLCRCVRCKASEDTLARAGQKTLLKDAEAAAAMACYPQRRVPVMLSSPHEAAPPFHEDWTIIDGSSRDPDKWEVGA